MKYSKETYQNVVRKAVKHFLKESGIDDDDQRAIRIYPDVAYARFKVEVEYQDITPSMLKAVVQVVPFYETERLDEFEHLYIDVYKSNGDLTMTRMTLDLDNNVLLDESTGEVVYHI